MEFSATTFMSGYVILAPQAAAITAPADLAGLSVAVTSSSARQALEALPAPPAKVVPLPTTEAALDALVAEEEVDAIVGRREAMMLASDTVGSLTISEEFLLREPYAFAFRQGDTALRDLVNLTLQQIVNEGTYGEIYRNNIYGYAADVFTTLPGQPTYTFADFPAEVLVGESVVERIRRGEAVRVAGLSLEESPATFDSQPIIDGYNRAVINEMVRRWNVPVVELPNSTGERGLQLLQNGEADIVVGVRPDVSLIGSVSLTTPYYQRALRLFHMDDVAVRGVGDLEFRPAIALPPEDVSRDLIQDNNAFPDPREAEDLEDAFRTLTLRAVDAVVADEYIAALMAQADNRIEIYDARYRPVDYAMAVSPTDAEFQTLINITLQDMAADGSLQGFAEQYFLPYRPEGDEIEQFTPELWPEQPLD
jgi:ABC-type amino acid transport substrate-binding protein